MKGSDYMKFMRYYKKRLYRKIALWCLQKEEENVGDQKKFKYWAKLFFKYMKKWTDLL